MRNTLNISIICIVVLTLGHSLADASMMTVESVVIEPDTVPVRLVISADAIENLYAYEWVVEISGNDGQPDGMLSFVSNSAMDIVLTSAGYNKFTIHMVNGFAASALGNVPGVDVIDDSIASFELVASADAYGSFTISLKSDNAQLVTIDGLGNPQYLTYQCQSGIVTVPEPASCIMLIAVAGLIFKQRRT